MLPAIMVLAVPASVRPFDAMNGMSSSVGRVPWEPIAPGNSRRGRRERPAGCRIAERDSGGRSWRAPPCRRSPWRGNRAVRPSTFVVEHPAVAPLGKARDRQARLTGFERAAPGTGASRLADYTPVETLVAGPLQTVDEIDHRPRRRVEKRDV